jgi:L-2,4-diaminobutyric acid acetyltransferase
MTRSDVKVRSCTPSDFAEVLNIVQQSDKISHHTSYTYWVALRAWPDLFLVAELDGEIVGFAFGLRAAEQPHQVFLWQIAVDPEHQRLGIGELLLHTLIARAARSGALELTTTISIDNGPSNALFRKIALAIGSKLVEAGTTASFSDFFGLEVIYSMNIHSAGPAAR